MQRRIQGAVLHLQHIVRSALYVSCDLMAMSWPEEERAQDEHIERALQECGLFGGVSRFHDSRDPTFSRVDARPSVTLAELVGARTGILWGCR